MKIVPLTQGYIAAVDDEDYERVMAAGPWHAHVVRHTVYARRNRRRQGKWVTEQLHRFILGLEGAEPHVDHINRHGLDCRRANMRLCSSSQNSANRSKRKGTSKYRGVSWSKKQGKWQAGIRVKGRQMHLGFFTNEVEAARAYDAVARACFGTFANLNFKRKT